MRDLGTLWEQCHNGTIPRTEWDYERKLTIDGVVYLDENIIKVEQEKGLLGNTISLGNTVSSKLKATVIPYKDHIVNRNSLVKLELRVVTLHNGTSDWYEFGYYYLDSAEKEADKWTIVCYDAMHKLEVPFTEQSTDVNGALNIILNTLGVSMDPRTSITNNIPLPKADEFTMREVLGYIGSLNFGNWHITEQNKLRLVKLSSYTPVWTVNKSNSKRIIQRPEMTFNKVIVKTSSNKKDRFIAGSGTNEFEIFNPWGSQELADSILSQLSSYTFFPGEVKSTEINPAVELGDTIEIEGNIVNLYQINYSTRMYADISTPDDTDRFQQYFHFESGGYNWEYEQQLMYHEQQLMYHEQRLNIIEAELKTVKETLGLSDCKIISDSEIQTLRNGKKRYTHNDPSIKCIIVPHNIEQLEIRGVNLGPDNIIKIKGGQGLTSAEDMFYEDYLKVDISELNTSKVKNFSGMFRDIESTGNVIIGLEDIDTRMAETMAGMFLRNRHIENLNLTYKTNKVKNMNSMFRSCKNLTILNISSFDTSNVETTEYMFRESNKLKKIDMRNADFSNLKDGSSMFLNCTSLETVILPHELRFGNVDSSYGLRNMFEGCSSLVDIRTSAFKSNPGTKIRNITSMFRGCSSLPEIDLSNLVVERSSSLANTFLGCENLTSLKLPKFDGSINSYTTISRTFRDTPNLKGVIDLRWINPMYPTEAFVNCGAEEIIINQSTYEGPFYDDLIDPANNPNGIPIRVVPDPWL